jgi:plastocyanin
MFLRHGQNTFTMTFMRIGKHMYMCCEMERANKSDWRVL